MEIDRAVSTPGETYPAYSQLIVAAAILLVGWAVAVGAARGVQRALYQELRPGTLRRQNRSCRHPDGDVRHRFGRVGYRSNHRYRSLPDHVWCLGT